MKISVKYFAALREAVGTGQEQLDLPQAPITVGAVRELLRDRKSTRLNSSHWE